MNQVLPRKLWVGHAGDGRDFRRIFDAAIEAVVYLAIEEPLPQVPRELICCRLPILDGNGNRAEVLQLAIQTTAHLISRRVPTLICCSAGMSRAPVIAAAAMSRAFQKPFHEMLAEVRQHHPCDVSPGLLADIQTLFESL